MKHIMKKESIPIAVVLATAALLAMTVATPLVYAQDYDGDQMSETNEKLEPEADCNFSGKGSTCIQVPVNVEIVGDIGA